MNAAIVLSGGTGSRMNIDRPKQYVEVNGKPIILYSLLELQNNPKIEAICIVVDVLWRSYLQNEISKYEITKKVIFSKPGSNRQRSIISGLEAVNNQFGSSVEKVLIHDAARPFISQKLINDCLDFEANFDGTLPVIAVKDTCYLCDDMNEITEVPERKKLYAGQAPECFSFQKYLNCHYDATNEVIDSVSGSAEFAFKMGLRIKCVQGDERNFKVTVQEDLHKMSLYLMQREKE